MSNHHIILRVAFTMDEMDGAPDESAEVAMDLLYGTIRQEHGWDDLEIQVVDFTEAPDE